MNRIKENQCKFVKFRFVVAGILMLAAGLKAYQLATAPLPPVVQGSIFTPLLELFNNRWLLMLAVEFEILFALVLIAGLWRKWAWLTSLLLFVGFTLVSLVKGVSGEDSCGCFGTIAINPWITMIFDSEIVGLLCFFSEGEKYSFNWNTRERVQLIIALSIWLILSAPAVFFMVSVKQSDSSLLGKEFKGPMGKMMVQLEPSEWIGKEIPLLDRLNGTANDIEQIKQGLRKVVLIHADCKKCLHLLDEIQEQKVERVIVIEVPSYSTSPSPKIDFPLFKLDTKNDWFVTTPCVIELDNGICRKVSYTK